MPPPPTPAWIPIGGGGLAFTAGYVNAVGFTGALRHGVTHITGQVTRVGIAMAAGDWTGVVHAASIVVWFFGGAVLSGALIRRPELSARRRRYSAVMAVEAAILAFAGWRIACGDLWADNLVAMAAGLQNAMATSYSGAVVRTTHMSGIATDLGILVGQSLRGEPVPWQRVGLLTVLFAGFLVGGMIGALLYPILGGWALAPPSVGLALASLGTYWATHRATEA